MIKFIAHRGLSSQAFENTIKSFTLAAQSDFF
jgi:glycerophosphoryl diester phosphodiesterase